MIIIYINKIYYKEIMTFYKFGCETKKKKKKKIILSYNYENLKLFM